jgi:hypothetical protein
MDKQLLKTPKDLYDWVVITIPGIQFMFSTLTNCTTVAEKLKDRFYNLNTIPGTLIGSKVH